MVWLEIVRERTYTFIAALGRNRELLRAMQEAGYMPSDHAEGVRLLGEVSGFVVPALPPRQSGPAAAHAEIERWKKTAFARARCCLRHKFPEHERFVLGGGDDVHAFLDRIDALERKKADRGALEALEARGLTPSERARVRALVAKATHTTFERDPPEPDRTEGLRQLHLWYQDWTGVAKTVFTDRRALIQLGIAKRRSGQSSDEP
jgi:hypothetical protein